MSDPTELSAPLISGLDLDSLAATHIQSIPEKRAAFLIDGVQNYYVSMPVILSRVHHRGKQFHYHGCCDGVAYYSTYTSRELDEVWERLSISMTKPEFEFGQGERLCPGSRKKIYIDSAAMQKQVSCPVCSATYPIGVVYRESISDNNPVNIQSSLVPGLVFTTVPNHIGKA